MIVAKYSPSAETAKRCEDFVGAEIEQAINDAMYAAFNDKQREFVTQDILNAATR